MSWHFAHFSMDFFVEADLHSLLPQQMAASVWAFSAWAVCSSVFQFLDLPMTSKNGWIKKCSRTETPFVIMRRFQFEGPRSLLGAFLEPLPIETLRVFTLWRQVLSDTTCQEE